MKVQIEISKKAMRLAELALLAEATKTDSEQKIQKAVNSCGDKVIEITPETMEVVSKHSPQANMLELQIALAAIAIGQWIKQCENKNKP